MPKCDAPKFRAFRGIMFMILGVSTALIFVAMKLEKGKAMQASVLWFGIGGLIFIIGACLYVARIPERFRPGTFDICGASHQLFHFAVIIGCAIHYYMNVNLFIRRHSFECPIWPNESQDISSFQII